MRVDLTGGCNGEEEGANGKGEMGSRVVKLLLIVIATVMKSLWRESNSNRLLKIPE